MEKPKIIEKIQKKNKYGRPGVKLSATKVAIHYTGKADVEASKTVSYFNNVVANGYKVGGKYIYASSHYVIGLEGEIYQLIPINEICYATNSANAYAIAVEVATTGDDNHYTDLAYKSMVHLCAWLCEKKNLNCKTDIITHTDVVGKNYKLCPIYMVKNPTKMQEFKKDCDNLKNGKIALEDIKNCTAPSVKKASEDFPRLIKIIKDVNYHKTPDFKEQSVIGIALKGEVLTIVELVKRAGTNMYKLRSGVYITSSTKYIELI